MKSNNNSPDVSTFVVTKYYEIKKAIVKNIVDVTKKYKFTVILILSQGSVISFRMLEPINLWY